jgi:hypothetical protein
MSDEDSDPIYQENPEFPEDEDPIVNEDSSSQDSSSQDESTNFYEETEDLVSIDYTRICGELLERLREDAGKGMFPMIIWKFLMKRWYSGKHMTTLMMMFAWIDSLREVETNEAKDWEKILMFASSPGWKEFPQEIRDFFARLTLKRNLMT